MSWIRRASRWLLDQFDAPLAAGSGLGLAIVAVGGWDVTAAVWWTLTVNAVALGRIHIRGFREWRRRRAELKEALVCFNCSERLWYRRHRRLTIYRYYCFNCGALNHFNLEPKLFPMRVRSLDGFAEGCEP